MDNKTNNIRPISTGDIGLAKYNFKLSNHHNVPLLSTIIKPTIETEKESDNNNGAIQINYTNRRGNTILRPRAPQNDSSVRNGRRVNNTGTKKKDKSNGKNVRKQKSLLITDLWDSLQHFSKNSLSRTLNVDSLSFLDSVHFVNINEDDTEEMQPKQNNSSVSEKFLNKREPVETLNGKIKMIDSTEFKIPELPTGKCLQFNIISTWGDPHYVGLMGIEVFDSSGHLVHLSSPDSQIWANPADINVLPEYGNDPRTVDNLVDGVNHTCDDLHAWLTPFTSGEDHLIFMEFDVSITISMIRIWNYNKSRIHSYRGARYLEMYLDNVPIFKGEIRKATGSHSILEFENCSECILFTTNLMILGLIEKYDQVAHEYIQAVADHHAMEQHFDEPGAFMSPKTLDEMYRHLYEKDEISTRNLYQRRHNNLIFKDESVDMLEISNPDAAPGLNVMNRPATTAKGVSRVNRGSRTKLVEDSPPADGEPQSSGRDRMAKYSVTSTQRDVMGSGSPTASAPIIGKKEDDDEEEDDDKVSSSMVSPKSRTHHKPYTEVGSITQSLKRSEFNYETSNARRLQNATIRPSTAAIMEHGEPVACSSIAICLVSNWGDPYSIGFCGIKLIDENMQAIDLPVPELYLVQKAKNNQGFHPTCGTNCSDSSNANTLNGMLSPRYNHRTKMSQRVNGTIDTKNQPFEVRGLTDDRTLRTETLKIDCNPDMVQLGKVLQNSKLNTTDPNQMFLLPKPSDHASTFCLEFKLPSVCMIKGLKIWNYNAGGFEGPCCGIKHLNIYIDERLTCQALVRKAPGLTKFDFSQFLPLLTTKKQHRSNEDLTAKFPFFQGITNAEVDEHTSSESVHAVKKGLDSQLPASTTTTEQTIELAISSSDSFDFKFITLTAEGNFDHAMDTKKDVNINLVTRSNAPLHPNGTTITSPDTIGMSYGMCEALQQYETPVHPSGCMLKIVIHSTHGDPYYVGLNGLQLFDGSGSSIQIRPDQIQCTPYRDVNDLPEIQRIGSDERRLENLLNGINDTFNDRYMWLVPFTGGASIHSDKVLEHMTLIIIFVLFDEPITLGCVKLWNYSKTSKRGIKEFELFLDDVLIFHGFLHPSPSKDEMKRMIDEETGSLKWGRSVDELDLSQSILFSNDMKLLERESGRIPLVADGIEFIDEGKHVGFIEESIMENKIKKTSHLNRPMTSVRGNN